MHLSSHRGAEGAGEIGRELGKGADRPNAATGEQVGVTRADQAEEPRTCEPSHVGVT